MDFSSTSGDGRTVVVWTQNASRAAGK
jgi:hypothetical protein